MCQNNCSLLIPECYIQPTRRDLYVKFLFCHAADIGIWIKVLSIKWMQLHPKWIKNYWLDTNCGMEISRIRCNEWREWCLWFFPRLVHESIKHNSRCKHHPPLNRNFLLWFWSLCEWLQLKTSTRLTQDHLAISSHRFAMACHTGLTEMAF